MLAAIRRFNEHLRWRARSTRPHPGASSPLASRARRRPLASASATVLRAHGASDIARRREIPVGMDRKEVLFEIAELTTAGSGAPVVFELRG
jgi:tRNA U34 5-methylaminomethyl-2-thiouridine-forming methyltransferase MnmC